MEINHPPLRVGWVGAGFVGQAAHLEHFVRFADAQVTGLAELRPMLRSQVASSFGLPSTYPSHLELLEQDDCEAVVVVVNRRHTFKVARDVLLSGRHLFTEKPMAQTADAAAELVSIAKSKNLTYTVGFMRRHDVGVLAAKKLIESLRDSGELGPVISVNVVVEAGDDYCNLQQRIPTLENRPVADKVGIAPEWLRANMHGDYERFVNVCSHDINLLRFLLGDSPKVTAVSHRAAGFSYALLEFPEFSGVFEWGYRPGGVEAGREGVDIRFERGEVCLRLPPAFLRNTSASVRFYRGRSTQEVGSCSTSNVDFSWSFERADRAFVRDVLTGSVPVSSGADSLKDFDFIDSIWQHLAY